jgi:hypothetical protein
MALDAQRSQLAEAERGEVATVRLDVVCDRRRRHPAGLQAQPAQRLDRELMRAPALPVGGAIQAMDVRRVGASAFSIVLLVQDRPSLATDLMYQVRALPRG